MKTGLLIACAALGLVGCTTERYRGGVESPYETEYGYGRARSMRSTALDTYDSIYPVRRQSTPSGTFAGDPKPAIDPSRERDYWGDNVPRRYDYDYTPPAPVPSPPPHRIP